VTRGGGAGADPDAPARAGQAAAVG
jgi:hypothetical protein